MAIRLHVDLSLYASQHVDLLITLSDLSLIHYTDSWPSWHCIIYGSSSLVVILSYNISLYFLCVANFLLSHLAQFIDELWHSHHSIPVNIYVGITLEWYTFFISKVTSKTGRCAAFGSKPSICCQDMGHAVEAIRFILGVRPFSQTLCIKGAHASPYRTLSFILSSLGNFTNNLSHWKECKKERKFKNQKYQLWKSNWWKKRNLNRC